MRTGIAGLLAACCVLMAACSDKTSVPMGILSIDKMTPIVWDMIEADQYAAVLVKDSAHINPKMERLQLYEQVFRSHGVSREKFEKSYNYYKEHPDINQILYDSLAAQGNRYRTESFAHPSPRPAVTPGTTAPAAPAGTSTKPAMRPGPLLHPPGRPGIPILRPFIKPDTGHRKPGPRTRPAQQKAPRNPASSTPSAKTPAH